QIVAIDHFGNAASNITASDLRELREPLMVSCCGECYGPVRRYYAQVTSGTPLAILNSAGRLELAVNCGRAIDLGAEVGSVVEVHET
ncbi:MAG: SAM-dependent chlorinase/fluorinase, partial [Armatimonadota bacterium]|nr:SAM-dependent chlorinase/fluorinase [Armatimonadota bacterium]